MKLETLKALLEIKNRKNIYSEILNFLEELDKLDNFTYIKNYFNARASNHSTK